MKVIIRSSPEAASYYTAHYIIDRINAFAPSADRPFVLGLPTGSSPESIYKILVEEYKAGNVSFEHVVSFNMDEYVGLPQDHPESYHSFMFSRLFSLVNIRPENVNILNGNAEDLIAECASYEAKIKSYGGIELFLGGCGTDGHIAFNEPGSSLESRTREQHLADATIRANSRFFGGTLDLVPRSALTVGVATIMEAREVVVIVTGAHKALAVQTAVEGGVSHMCTLSCLQQHPRSMIVADEDATLEMKVKTVKYFTSIERSTIPSKSRFRDQKLGELSTPRKREFATASEEDIGDLTPDSMSQRIRWDTST